MKVLLTLNSYLLIEARYISSCYTYQKKNNGAPDGSLLELFNRKFIPIILAPKFLPLHNDIENYLKGQDRFIA